MYSVFRAGPRYPERRHLNGLPPKVAYILIRAANEGFGGGPNPVMSAGELTRAGDVEILSLRGVGPKTLAVIRAHFPYDERDGWGEHAMMVAGSG